MILIVGAGIAGPALGIALRRAGIDTVIYEASDRPRDDAGAFLNLAPNGLSVLRELGLGRRVDGLGFQNDRLVFHNETGRMLADVAVGGNTLMRGALSRALREAAEEVGVRFEFGKALSSVTVRDGGVEARFADGTSAHGSSLVGADGIHSRTRYTCFPDAPKPSFTDIINLGGVVHTTLPETGTAMHMIFGRRSFFGYAVRPGGETYWFSNFAQKEEPRGTLERFGVDRVRRDLLHLHRDDPPEVTQILQAITGNVGAWPVYDIPSLPVWHRGAVCLLGDAAHAIGPHVGQGASLALEDAFVLAKCMRDIPDAPRAFATFEHLRRDRVEPVVKQSRRTGRQKAPTGWIGRKMRDLILPTFLKSSAQAAQELYGFALDWNERIAYEA
ncbi:MAG TPA: NAD(P)/FAD-dependent oxidoreductase [Vicinamibacterales bacterium]|nr:NAD(P)/FAD-dependent oxidoreductase [Vicinamibacterales bacterium]